MTPKAVFMKWSQCVFLIFMFMNLDKGWDVVNSYLSTF